MKIESNEFETPQLKKIPRKTMSKANKASLGDSENDVGVKITWI